MNLFMRFPGGKAKTFTMSYDDGVEQDVRLIAIMNRHGLKGTFNLNSGAFAAEGTVYPKGTIHRRMTEKEVRALYADSGHEVAVHALTHPFLEQLPSARVGYEVLEDRRRLEAMFGYTVRGMAYPFGTTSDTVVEILKQAGIAYARTTVSTEKFGLPQNWLRLPATCHHKNPKLMELAEKFLKPQDRAPLMFYLWGHSYEFEADNNWDVIERFAEKIGGHEDIWYATNIEIYDYIHAYQQLRFSVDMSFVENPTITELYFRLDNQDYSIKPGETVRLSK